MRTRVARAFDRAVDVLTRNRAALDAGARMLEERETLTRDELPPVAPAAVGGPISAPVTAPVSASVSAPVVLSPSRERRSPARG